MNNRFYKFLIKLIILTSLLLIVYTVFTLASYKIIKRQTYNELNEIKKFKLNVSDYNYVKPLVLIYHTHTSEGYKPAVATTLNKSLNVCEVGDVLAASLTSLNNMKVIHDTNFNDDISYLMAYKNSKKILQNYLVKYGDIKLIVDLHRDSVENKKSITTKIDGKNTSTFRFVLAKSNPHFNKNAEVVSKLIKISNKLYPGLCRETYYYNKGTDYFNQAMSNNACLIEVGSYVSNIVEANNTAICIAKIITQYFNENS